ncbi:MAG: glycerate kinase type-2 family protein [Promethearchaeota archaeon]
MVIKNRTQLLSSELNENEKTLRQLSLDCLEIAIESVRPKLLLERSITFTKNELIIEGDIYNIESVKRFVIIGAGKASGEMALSLEQLIKNNTSIEYEGLINIPKGLDIHQDRNSKIIFNFASHPIPDEDGVYGAKKMLEMGQASTDNTLIFCLISGGGSALLPFPKEGVSLADLKEMNSLLLASGANIHEINTLRKHLSEVKGGNLIKNIRKTSNSTIISLIISDVIGDNLDIIASGPTVPDLSTSQDAMNVIKKYNLFNKLPHSIIKILNVDNINQKKNINGSNNNLFQKVHNYLIGSVKLAVIQIKEYLINRGYKSNYFSDSIKGEARNFAKDLCDLIQEEIKYNETHNYLSLIGTGELTVTLKGKGIGGRNQEMLLNLLNHIKVFNDNLNFLVLAINLDGIEGNSQAMGALIDNSIIRLVEKEEIDIEEYLNDNNSNSFFKLAGTEIITGPTGCNVNDLVLVLLMR